jgi:hypothetical protein
LFSQAKSATHNFPTQNFWHHRNRWPKRSEVNPLWSPSPLWMILIESVENGDVNLSVFEAFVCLSVFGWNHQRDMGCRPASQWISGSLLRNASRIMHLTSFWQLFDHCEHDHLARCASKSLRKLNDNVPFTMKQSFPLVMVHQDFSGFIQ